MALTLKRATQFLFFVFCRTLHPVMMHHYTKFGYKTKILLTVQKYLLDKARHTARQTGRYLLDKARHRARQTDRCLWTKPDRARQTDRCLLDKARHMARQTGRCLLDKARHRARQTDRCLWTKPDRDRQTDRQVSSGQSQTHGQTDRQVDTVIPKCLPTPQLCFGWGGVSN